MYLAICEDEISQAKQITSILEVYRKENMPSLRWSTFQSGFSLLSAMDQGQVFDGILLDIYIPDMNGIDIARSIRTMNENVNIVFLTVSSDFAVESYQVDACDYVLKPVNQDKLFRILDKLVKRIIKEEQQGLMVKNTEGGMTKIICSQLMYVEAMGHHSILYNANGSSTKTVLSFSSLLAQFNVREEFIQIHRSYMVNLHYVHRIAKNKIILLNGTVLPLPKSRYGEVLDTFQKPFAMDG